MSSEHEIDVQVDEHFVAEIDSSALMAAAEATLHHQGVTSAALTLVVTDDEEVQRLNRIYRGFDEPTDVLSFAEQDGLPPLAVDNAGDRGNTQKGAQLILPPELIAQQSRYLGDIIIAFPYTKKQAAHNHRSLRGELCLLAIHGTLHLLGFDHATPAEEAEMWAIQNSVLETLGEEPMNY